jgi:hypothetical protein
LEDYLVCNIVAYKLSIEGWLFFALHNFLKCFWRRKTNFYRPTTIHVLKFYVKELLWNEKSRERSPTEFGVPSVSGEQEEVALSFYEEAAEDGRWRDSLAAGGS